LLLDEKSGRLVAGHGRLDALLSWKRQGKEPPKGVRIEGGDWVVPVIRGISFDTEAEAEAYLLADNQLGALGGWMENMLAQVLQDHADHLEGTGFDTGDLDELMKDLYPPEDAEGGGDNQPRIVPELFERYDYVVLLFTNEIDWNRAMELFDIQTVATGPVGGKSAKFAGQQKGLGRVIFGDRLFQIIDGLRYGKA
jgi:hypothetical protein